MSKLNRKISRGFVLHDKKSMNENQRFRKKSSHTNFDNDNMAFIDHLNEDELISKSARHLKDALYQRTVRNDLDYLKSYIATWAFNIQTSPFYDDIFNMLSWIFLGLSFFEDGHYHLPPQNFWEDTRTRTIFIVESVIMLLFMVNTFLEITHMQSLYRYRITTRKNSYCITTLISLFYYEEIHYSFRLITDIVLYVDFVVFYAFFPYNIFRFSRLLRPFKLISFSKQLRKVIWSFLGALTKIVDIFLFFIVISLVMATIGFQIFSEVPVTEELKSSFKDHTSFLDLTLMIYILISFDNWPAMAKPMIKHKIDPSDDNVYYLIYFLPFVIANALFFFPIPIAVIFDSFRKNRGQRIVSDQLYTKHALFVSFTCLDWDNDGFITFGEWCILLEKSYGPRIRKDCLRSSFDKMLDHHDTYKLSSDKFVEFVKVYNQQKKLIVVDPYEFYLWKKFKQYTRRWLFVDKICKSIWFELFIFFLIILNSAMLVYSIFFADENQQKVIEVADKLFLFLYIIEGFVKIVGYGLSEYYRDPWNKFDVSLITMDILTLLLLDYLNVFKNFRSVRILKITKIQRAVKMVKALKCVRSFRFVMGILQSFYRMKNLIENIFISLPSVWKTFTLIVLFNYAYAVIGMEIFRNSQIVDVSNPYGIGNFGDLKSAMLELAHIMIANGWSELMLSYGRRFDDLLLAVTFFISYHAITNIVLKSLISGLVWEVFSYVRSQKEPLMLAKQEKKEDHDLKKGNDYFSFFRDPSNVIVELNSQSSDGESDEEPNYQDEYNLLRKEKASLFSIPINSRLRKAARAGELSSSQREPQMPQNSPHLPGDSSDMVIQEESISDIGQSPKHKRSPVSISVGKNSQKLTPKRATQLSDRSKFQFNTSKSLYEGEQQQKKAPSDFQQTLRSQWSFDHNKDNEEAGLASNRIVNNNIDIMVNTDRKGGNIETPNGSQKAIKLQETFRISEKKLNSIMRRGRAIKKTIIKHAEKSRRNIPLELDFVDRSHFGSESKASQSYRQTQRYIEQRRFRKLVHWLHRKTNVSEVAFERLKRFLTKNLRSLLLNCNSSLFFRFYDRHFEQIEDLHNPPKADVTSGNIEDLNEMFMIRRAMMKGRNDDDLRKMEINFLEKKYGNIVPDLNRYLTVENIRNIHLRNRMVGILQKTLADPNPKIETFFRTIVTIVYNVNKMMLPEGSYFNFFLRNRRRPGTFMIISSDNIDNISMHNCRISEFSSDYLNAISICAKEYETAYYGFDVLGCKLQKLSGYFQHFKTTINEEIKRLNKSSNFSKFGDMHLYNNIWQGIMLKNGLNEEEPVKKEIDDLAAKRRESLDYDDFMYNEVVTFCLHHFVSKKEAKVGQGKAFIQKVGKALLNQANHNQDKGDSGKHKDGHKTQAVHLPDIEFIEFMKDLGEVISIHQNSFFTLCSKIKVFKNLFSQFDT